MLKQGRNLIFDIDEEKVVSTEGVSRQRSLGTCSPRKVWKQKEKKKKKKIFLRYSFMKNQYVQLGIIFPTKQITF